MSDTADITCLLCNGTMVIAGELGAGCHEPCPKCVPKTWGPYELRGDRYVLTQRNSEEEK
jgi:hypothetical protein